MYVMILITVITNSEPPKYTTCTFAIILAKYGKILVLFSLLQLMFKFNLILNVFQIYQSY